MSNRSTCRTALGHFRRAAASCGALLASLTAALALAGCGQTGPLALPDAARPIERLDPTARPPESEAQPPGGAAQPSPGASVGTTPPAQREPDAEDDRSNDSGDNADDRSTGAPR